MLQKLGQGLKLPIDRTRLLKRLVWIIPALLLGLVLLLPLVRGLETLELLSFDARQLTVHENRASSHISLIEVDDSSLSSDEFHRLFGRYPPRRDIYACLLRFLDRGHAQKLLIDLSFTGGNDQDHPEADRALADTLRHAHLQVMSDLGALDLTERSDALSDTQQAAVLAALRNQWLHLRGYSPYLLYIHPLLAAQPPLANLLTTPMRFYPYHSVKYDLNGHVRRAVLVNAFYGGRLFLPTLSLGALMDSNRLTITPDGQLQAGGYRIDLKGETQPIIRWYGNLLKSDNAPVYPRYSFWQLVKSQLLWDCQKNPGLSFCKVLNFRRFNPINPALFQNQIVLLGMATNSYDQDNHPSLYDSENSRKYPGMYIQATILDNLLHNEFVRRTGWRIPIYSMLEHWLHLPPGAINADTAWLPIDSVSVITLLTSLLFAVGVSYSCLRWQKTVLSSITVLLLCAAYTFGTVWAYQQWNLWINWVYPIFTAVLSFLVSSVLRYLLSERHRHRMRHAFSKYVSAGAMRNIDRNLESGNTQALGQDATRQEITVLFVDMRNFTAFSELHEPEVVQDMLNLYFSLLNGVIVEHHGAIGKLMGDAVMAYWGYPQAHPDDAFRAVCAALDMKAAIAALLPLPNGKSITIGVGINTGVAMVGNIGSDHFMDFTIIGDTVNTASRLESMNKEFGSTIIIARSTRELLGNRVRCRELGSIAIRGKETLTEIFEPLETLLL